MDLIPKIFQLGGMMKYVEGPQARPTLLREFTNMECKMGGGSVPPHYDFVICFLFFLVIDDLRYSVRSLVFSSCEIVI